MQSDSLFGHLAVKSSHPENVATDALNYILNRSKVAHRAFLNYVRQADVDLPDGLLFRTQGAGDDNAVPDLVGTDAKSRQVFLGEAKFWAGLTSNQPVTYLKRLPTEVDGLLLFIAPVRRFDTLWAELLRRCQNEGFAVEQPREDMAKEFRAIKIESTRTLAITSWRAILLYILRALETEGEHDAASDVKQLQGLCNRMDSDAFLPLRAEELTSDTGRRIVQYCQIVDEAIEQAVAAGFASKANLRPTSRAAFSGRYFLLAERLCHLQFNGDLWGRLRATPLWLCVYHDQVAPWIKDALVSLEREQPSRLLPAREHFLIPIDLPIGVEKQEVVSDVCDQMKEVAQLLREYELRA